jgi:hypothetical protein
VSARRTQQTASSIEVSLGVRASALLSTGVFGDPR